MNKILSGIKTLLDEIKRIVRREKHFRRAEPILATFFLTFRCNSHCRTCTLWKRSKEEEIKREIGLAEWKIIIDQLHAAGIKNAEIFGGNVLLRKELLIPLLKYLREKNMILHLPTNQIGLDDEIAQAIVSYVDFLYLSVDGIDNYQDAIRGQDGASQRVENTIAKLLKLRATNKTPRIICNTTVSKYNVAILDKLVDYAISKKFDDIHFEYVGVFSQEHIDHSLIDGLKPAPYYIKQNESVLVDKSQARLLKRNLKNIKKKYSASDISISTVNIDVLSEENLYKGTIPHKKCYVERTEVTVDPAGNIVICPFVNNYIIGNLLKTPFAELWNNPLHLKFRNCQNSGSLEMCDHCILGVQRNPGVLMSLKRQYFTRIQPYLIRLSNKL